MCCEKGGGGGLGGGGGGAVLIGHMAYCWSALWKIIHNRRNSINN